VTGGLKPPCDRPRENPYVGLMPFGEHDLPWFFGRDRERRIIGANLRSARLTLLYGASGVGKSSVLQAAVLPDLRAVVARDRALRERADPSTRLPVRFAVSIFGAWRDAPLLGLTSAVAASVVQATGEPVAPWTPGTALRETFAAWLGPVTTLLIVLDQFEEHFLYHPFDDGPGTFAGEFVEVVDDPSLRVNFLLSLREDGLAKLDRFQGRVPGLFDNYLRIDHLDLAAARRAIEGPRDEYNRRLPAGSPAAEVDAELIDAVIDEVRTREPGAGHPRGPAQEAAGAPAAEAVRKRPGMHIGSTGERGPGRVETPLLQLVLSRLWEAAALEGAPPHLRLATLRERLGGTERIVYRHLEDALAALPDDRRDAAVDVLRPLVSPTGTKIAWRAADLAHFAKRPAADIEPILRELSSGERRILRALTPPAGQADASPRYEIFHDILATPILEWCTAREAERERAALALEVEAQELARRKAERRRRRARRNRGVGILLALVVAGLIAAVLVAFDRNELADSRALAARATAQLEVDPELGLLLAMQAMRRRDTSEARQALRRALVTSRVRAVLGSGRPRPCAACAGLATPAPAAATRAGTVAEAVAIAPDGRTVAGVVGGRVKIWQPQTGATFAPRVRTARAQGVAFTPDASRLLVLGRATAGDSPSAVMAPDGTSAVALRDDLATGNDAATSPDGRRVVTTGPGGAAVWDARDGRRLARLTDYPDGYIAARFADANEIALQDGGGNLVSWRWRESSRSALLADARPGERDIGFFAAGAGLDVDGVAHGKARVVDARGVALTLAPGTAADPVTRAAISPDGTRIATVRGSVVELWASRRWRSASPAGKLVHGDGVTAVAFSADSKLVGTASTDRTARVWESATGELLADLPGHAAGVQGLAFSSRGRYVATLGEDLTIRLWDLGAARTLRGSAPVAALAVARSGEVAIAPEQGSLRIWDTRTGKARAIVSHKQQLQPTSAAIAARAGTLLVGYAAPATRSGRLRLMSLDGRIRVDAAIAGSVRKVALDAAGGVAAIVRESAGASAEIWSLAQAHPDKPIWRVTLLDAELPSDVALSGDGRRLLVTTVYGLARIYDMRTHRPLRTLAAGTVAHPGPEAFYRAAFSPDGTTVAVAGSRDVRLYDAGSGDERRRLSGHTSVLRSVAFSADGRRIVTASADGTVRVWSASTGVALAVLGRHAGRVNDAAFLPDGWIVSGGEDRAVRAYPCETCAPTGDLLDLAARRVTREPPAGELGG
jgi:WD40 repeat protein